MLWRYHTISFPTKTQDKADSSPYSSNADHNNADDDNADNNAADDNADNDAATEMTDDNADSNTVMQTTDDNADNDAGSEEECQQSQCAPCFWARTLFFAAAWQ